MATPIIIRHVLKSALVGLLLALLFGAFNVFVIPGGFTIFISPMNVMAAVLGPVLMPVTSLLLPEGGPVAGVAFLAIGAFLIWWLALAILSTALFHVSDA